MPVPEHVVVDRGDRGAALAFLQRAAGPCVVKPAQGGGGEGVTGAVTNDAQLTLAMRHAGLGTRWVIVERQLAGDHYRLLLLDGEVLDVLRRERPVVVGNGRSTIEQLMFSEYERRLRSEDTEGLKPFPMDLDCLFTLEAQDLRPSSVPAPDAVVVVKTAS
ncbi:MAG TPA: hypothetical protein VNH40_13740, partial [Gaiellaceae bacterium]|nr:hypothetical protein [Gaiellaceae bacterium]